MTVIVKKVIAGDAIIRITAHKSFEINHAYAGSAQGADEFILYRAYTHKTIVEIACGDIFRAGLLDLPFILKTAGQGKMRCRISLDLWPL